jgi:hypothetical protein
VGYTGNISNGCTKNSSKQARNNRVSPARSIYEAPSQTTDLKRSPLLGEFMTAPNA